MCPRSLLATWPLATPRSNCSQHGNQGTSAPQRASLHSSVRSGPHSALACHLTVSPAPHTLSQNHFFRVNYANKLLSSLYSFQTERREPILLSCHSPSRGKVPVDRRQLIQGDWQRDPDFPPSPLLGTRGQVSLTASFSNKKWGRTHFKSFPNKK